MSTTQTGRDGEAMVADQLIKDGYKILDQNWRTPFAEIDIIAQKDATIFFIEVKYRKTAYAGDGFDYVTRQKLHHMERAAQAWVQEYEWPGPYELMVAAVDGQANLIDIRPV